MAKKKAKTLTDAQIETLGDQLIDTSKNIYTASEALFGIKAVDADFVRLRKIGKMFRCEECSRWWPISEECSYVEDKCRDCADEEEDDEDE